MSPEFIETGLFRRLLGVLGILITLVAVLGLIDSIGIGLGGIEHKDIWAISFSFGYILSCFGLFGAWFRLSSPYKDMSSKKVMVTRALLQSGLLSTIFLSAGTIGIFGYVGLYVVVNFAVVAIGGVIFLNATPKVF